MTVEALSRLQFATVALFHFLFVPLTLGLSVMVAFMETRYAKTGDETWLDMTKYWSRLLLVNFAVGVVTGITLEFQFGMNWAEYSKFVGDIFGAPLAIEATVAFFLESTFIGVWVFSWKRVSRGTHAGIMWLVAGASTLSALWILLANSWMQKPRGYTMVVGHAHLAAFGALIWNPYAWIKFFHVIMASWTLTAFFIMGICAIHMLRGRASEMVRKSFRTAAPSGWRHRCSSSSPGTSLECRSPGSSRQSSLQSNPSGRPRREPLSTCSSFPTHGPSATSSRRFPSRGSQLPRVPRRESDRERS